MMGDLDAILRVKNEDIGGLEFLIAKYQSKALRTAYLITHESQCADEVVQNSFIRFYERARNFDERKPFEPYFLRMVVNSALNMAEKKEHKHASLDDDENLYRLERLLAQTDSIEDTLVLSQIKDEIRNAIRMLTPRQRVVIVQRYYLEMNEAEMVKELNISSGAIKGLLHTARLRLRRLLIQKESTK
jgi:RNA polymerase sigma-70 factor (ECF subfamily)